MLNRTNKRRKLLKDLFGSDTEDEEEQETDSLEELEFESDQEKGNKPRVRRRPNKERSHMQGHKKLMEDYFNENSTYDDQDFERRFRLRRELFLKIASDVERSILGTFWGPALVVLALNGILLC
ncbi:uncharacterized protein PGTG_11977 [Puccinia graminis f. sp. tritici CRL 75-36-700-3]|uniref:Uncharacterized protein n=1 Tax=Puccinia graminis f. sp. tritici (strain CRL 75-36-700-3 / race SCCL) TaxID=418459 RepID=E3KNZ6_PUCGT|nr:uncharacterized protein PGTG_11977 [Puccinia graminis f. sp. tritici CRL 75-36-700-3]EFP86021.1 hypothetical protein PGTG_11977 [Puccinia graminis f. sp. tritici CRL 75-36-700-3]